MEILSRHEGESRALDAGDWVGVVLVLLTNATTKKHEYVTWNYNRKDGETIQEAGTYAGHYTKDGKEAFKDYSTRVNGLLSMGY